MKFSLIVGHNPRINRLDFGGNPDLDPDQIFLNKLYHCRIGNGKGWVRQQS